jgi:putative SOS response-associated peptidase YedK
MCTNYRTSSRDIVRDRFKVQRREFEYPDEAYPLFRAPIIRRPWQHDGRGEGRECVAAIFGLIPHWAKDNKIGRQTYNARSETVAERPSYRNAWRRGQRCLVPVDAFYEPNYESGKPIRWKIALVDREPFAVAGIWERWIDPATRLETFSFSMMTVNAEEHAVMRRFQARDRGAIKRARHRSSERAARGASAVRIRLHGSERKIGASGKSQH